MRFSCFVAFCVSFFLSLVLLEERVCLFGKERALSIFEYL